MTIQPGFTLCFLLNGDDVLMLHRKFPPNQGLWNGVGGHIEPGETASEAVIREVAEETGYQIESADFAGLMTWDGFEIPPGAIAMFTAQAPHRDYVTNHEGDLAWQPREWACTAPEVVDNIHVFLPKVLAGEGPLHFHFSYHNGKRVRDVVEPMPVEFDLDRPFQAELDLLEEERGEFLLSFDKDRLQLDRVEEFLVKGCYWASDRSRAVIETSIRNSVCLGIYRNGLQVAFARLVTDRATFAWLCDVYVEDAQRGQALGKWLVESACRYTDRLGIGMTILATRDAHGLYAGYGHFRPLDVPDKWMRRDLPKKD
jgi:8-oxo-dGTP pyrophosphatase MutT (NUDIX family)